MKKYPNYTWLNHEGLAFCDIEYKGLIFSGTAQCHPEDRDMMSKLTGETIAEFRATIKYLKFIRDFELRPQLKSLKQLYYSMNTSKHFDSTSYEAKMLYRQINLLEEDIKEIQLSIKTTKEDLKLYLQTKEKDHATLREFIAKRELVENNQNTCE